MDTTILQSVQGYQGYLRGERPNLASGQNPELMVISCADSRVQPAKIFDFPPGGAFEHSNIGAFIQPKEVKDPSLDAFLNYPVGSFKNLKAIMVLGHTHCGGVKGLVNAVLQSAAKETNDVNNWVVPLAHDPLVHAIKDAQSRGVPEAEITSVMEYIMPLLSAQRLMERELTYDGQKHMVGDILKQRNIAVVPAVYDLDSRTVQLFDKESLQYRPLQEMLQTVEKMASDKASPLLDRMLGTAQGEPIRLPQPLNAPQREAQSPVFQHTISVSMGNHIPLSSLKKGVQVGINEISRLQTGAERARA